MHTKSTSLPFKATLAAVVFLGLYLASLRNYLLFHTMVEMFSIVVAFGIFTIGWNSRYYIKSNYLLFLAIAYLFIAFLDLLHTMSYKGMGIFTDYDYYANQVWIATRYMESLSLLAAFWFLKESRAVNAVRVFSAYFALTAVIVAVVFWWRIFPVCFVDGIGLTPFKKNSEYVICLILGAATWLLFRMRDRFDPVVHRWLVWSLVFTICSELAFTFYISNYGFSNLVGHYFKLFSFYFIYRALVATGITAPHAVLFRALQDSETKFRGLVESSRDLIWEVDEALRYTYVSPLAPDILGYAPEEMLGRTPFDFMPPGQAGAAREAFREAAVSGAPVHRENTVLSTKGREVVMETRGVAILDADGRVAGYRGVDRDVTGRKHRELELRQLQRAVESSPIGIVITSTGGIIEYGNPVFFGRREITGVDALGRDIAGFLGDGAQDPAVRGVGEAMRAGRLWRGDLARRNYRGDLVWEQVMIAPVTDRQGTLVNFVATFEDITDRKVLEKLKEDVEQIMRHDLKSPLNGIIGIPQLLIEEGNLSEQQVELVQLVESTGYRILGMVDHSLDLFKMETGVYEYIPVEVDVAEVVEAVLKDHASPARSKNIAFNLFVERAACGADGLILSDKDLLYRMLSNFVANAVDASPVGGAVDVSLEGVPCRVIRIRNRGAVPAEIRDQFFEKYKTWGKKRGTGLGTYSSKLMADAMGYGLHLDTSDEDDVTVISILLSGA
ncbi:MASE3 domain-containing protein [Pseudodesulfovibrio hydrargyri]|uniref:MASE3 domain-containing protein n=1 Tax=Pseudodesulfovibrio hydrargyri TaxID=2125990 RepID=UPI0008FAFCE0|nr:MASE3 domain-containing protein [Pseudodesulfovibrio hydrargyri]